MRLAEEDGVDNDAGDQVGVAVGGGAAVLEVALAVNVALAGDTDGRATVRDTCC